MDEPNIKLNPSASSRYEITAHAQDLPGRFDTVMAFANYQVTNEACVPVKPVSGVKVIPTKQINLDLIRVDDETFKIEVFADKILDADYFGHGVCHWSLTAATFSGTIGKTRFNASLTEIPQDHEHTQTRFYSKNMADGTLDTVDAGLPNAASYDDAANTFRISMSTKGPVK